MSILDQIRNEAAKIVDTHSLEIIEAAQNGLVQSRFTRLRKGKKPASSPQERAYIHALNQYVFYKLQLHRANKNYTYMTAHHNLCYHYQKYIDYWRNEMDSIEFGPELSRYELNKPITHPGYASWETD